MVLTCIYILDMRLAYLRQKDLQPPTSSFLTDEWLHGKVISCRERQLCDNTAFGSL